MIILLMLASEDSVVVRRCGEVKSGARCLESTLPSNGVFIATWVSTINLIWNY